MTDVEDTNVISFCLVVDASSIAVSVEMTLADRSRS